MFGVFFRISGFQSGFSGFWLGKSDPITDPYKVRVIRVRVFRVFSKSGPGGFKFGSDFR
ncbi:hypothetical protein HanRHA438_Chr16g0768191 [Helianthus annuus]|nr:hypothetical protein HanRHA438_Chr16g0768191 [Helianthus annuus]